MDKSILSDEQLKILNVVTDNAAVTCSRTFSRWVKSGVMVEMKGVRVIPFHEVIEKVNLKGEESYAVYLRIEQGLEGSLLFICSCFFS